jgi:hypothetical protein
VLLAIAWLVVLLPSVMSVAHAQTTNRTGYDSQICAQRVFETDSTRCAALDVGLRLLSMRTLITGGTGPFSTPP